MLAKPGALADIFARDSHQRDQENDAGEDCQEELSGE
jgi:hypothetical protein